MTSTTPLKQHYVIYRNGAYCFSSSNFKAVYDTFSNSVNELNLCDFRSYSKVLRSLRSNGQVTIETDSGQRYVISQQPLYRNPVPASELLKYA